MREDMQQKGFIQIPILIAIIVGVFVTGGASYVGVKQYRNHQAEQIQQEAAIETNQVTGDDELSEVEKLRQEVEELKKEVNPPALDTSTPKQSTPAVSEPIQPETQQPEPTPNETQPYVPPPTSQQLQNIRRLCILDKNAPICTDENFMPGYISYPVFRTAVDPLINAAIVLLEAQHSQQISDEIRILDCLAAPTPEDERMFDPATQNYLRQLRCGTVTDADKTNYELSRIKSSVDELKYRLETKTSFTPVLFDTLDPTDWGTRWEIRWDGFGGGTIKDSTGGFYQFRCETNYCVSY